MLKIDFQYTGSDLGRVDRVVVTTHPENTGVQDHLKKITMKINIQSPSFHPSDKLIDFTNDKIEKLFQYSARIIEALVVLRVVKSDDRSNKICEIRLSIPGHDLFASKKGPSFEEAVLKTVEVLKYQLVRWKESMEQGS